MIIYGWGYFNRRDHSVIRGTCQACGHHGHLPSYTSSKFFTLYFIPLIPLGTQKVITDCPHCKQSRVLPLRKWNKLRKTELPAAVTAYEASPTNEEAAKNVLGSIIGLQDRAALRRIGPQVRKAFERDAKMLTFLAGTYDYLCQDQEADEAYLAAMSLSDDADIAAEANTHMELQKQPKPTPPNRLLQSLPVLIVPGVLLFLLTLFVQRAATSRIEDAYVLNGLGRGYTAMINGHPIKVGPFQRIPTDKLVYGKNEITPTAESPFIEAGSFEINLAWHRRPFGGPLVVVNPDQAALMLWERTGYAYPKAPENTYSYKFTGGRVSHVYEDIDFPFRDFPAEVEVPTDGSVVHRTRVSDLGQHEVQQALQILIGNNQTEDLQRYLRARLRAENDEVGVIYAGAGLLPREDFLELAGPRLEARPVLIQWHRAYQNVVEGKPEGRDLVARYRALVHEEPENSALLYLLSRVIEDPDENIATLRRAAALPNPTAYAAHGLAYRHLIDGDFKAARESCELAQRLEPKNVQFATMRVSALYGLKDFATLEKEAGNLMTSPDASLVEFYEHLYRLAKLGRTPAARAEIPKIISKLAISQEEVPPATAYLESAMAIATQDRAAYITAAARVADPTWALQKAIIAGELDEVLRLAKATPDELGLLEHLTLYVLLQRASRAEAAAAQLEQAIADLADGNADHLRWAEWLRGDVAPEPRLAAHTCDDLDAHGVYLCALAQKFPARADEYLARAAAMRFKDTFHTLALEAVLPR